MPHFSIPSHVIIGKNALEDARIYLRNLGNRAFIVTGKHIGKSPMINQLEKILTEENIAYYIFDGITGEPTDKMIEEGTELYKKYACQFCIGIGGGSPLDSAKAIAALAANGWKISDYKVEELCKTCEIPTLKEYGIDEDEFIKYIPKMAEDAILSGSPGNTRKNLIKEDCMEIYKRIYFS